MRIISKYHDYYDSAMGYGQDQTIIYKRDLRFVGVDHDLYCYNYESNEIGSQRPTKSIISSVLFFCGKSYPFVTFSDRKEFFYDFESYYDFISEHRDIYSRAFDRTKSKSKQEYYYWNNFSEQDYFKEKKLIDPTDYHFKFNCPVILAGSNSRTRKIFVHGMSDPNRKPIKDYFQLNPILKDVQFYKVMDSFSAFQEVDMYISGILGNDESSMVSIDDDMMAKKKGFGDKYDFRRLPTKKLKLRRN